MENSEPVSIPRANTTVEAKIDGKQKGKSKSPAGLSPPIRHPDRPFTRGSRRNTGPRSFNRGESFATASEGLSSGGEMSSEEQEEDEEEGEEEVVAVEQAKNGESSRPEQSRAYTAPTRSSAIAPNTAPLRINMGLSRSTGFLEDMRNAEPIPFSHSDEEDSVAGSVPPSVEASNSLASLLKHDELARRNKLRYSESHGRPPLVHRTSVRPSILSISRKRFNSPKKKIDRTESRGPAIRTSAQRSSTNRDRVCGGLVRFNTAVDLRERDKQMQLKLADLSRGRAFRHVGRHYPRARKKEGEIIKMENMLVRVETTMKQVPNEYDENESMKIETRTTEKWREYVVVCRETGEEESPFALLLYKSRVIPAIDRPHLSSYGALEIPLNPKTTKINLYSSLDKTLVIWLPWKKGNIIYIMRPRCSSSSVEWYTFLWNALGWARPDVLQIYVPDLSLSLRIENPFEKIEEKLQADDYDDEVPLKEENVVAKNLLSKSMGMLEGVKEWADILEHWKKNERMGLAWRRYDRLEWIHGV